jgi:hypothetical protein
MAVLNLNKMISEKKDIWVRNTTSDKKVSIRIEGSQTMYPAILPTEHRCLTDELSYEQIDKSDIRQLARKGFLAFVDPEEMKDAEHTTPKVETPEVSAEDLKKTRVKSTVISETQINPRVQQIKLWFQRENDKGTEVPEFDGRNVLDELKRMEQGLSGDDLGFLLSAKKIPPAIKKWAQDALDKKQQTVPAGAKGKGANVNANLTP